MTYPWKRRFEGESTNRYLARVLDETGLPGLAENARNFHYDDYFRPAEMDDGMNLHALVAALDEQVTSRTGATKARRIAAIREAASNGEFDGTAEEAERWGASPSGQATFRMLLRDD